MSDQPHVSEAATIPPSSPPAPTRPNDSEAATLPPTPADPDGAGFNGETNGDRALPAVPGYEILRELGRGGMGVVYQARQTNLDRMVALKMILGGGHAGPDDLARFKTEAEAVARLQHPNIVQIFEVGEHGGLPFFSLEFCVGGSLDRKLAGTPLPPKEAAALVEKLARAMQAAHEKGVIHRDLKPANVLLAEDGTPKITDFGLAKKLDAAGQTQSGAVMGTPSYMAPEQAGGKAKEMGPACDVYALGAILYECLTGRPPFKAATPLDTILQVVADDPAPPRQLQSKTPLDLETVCLKCLEKRTERRYRTALELAEELRRFQAGEPVKARRVRALERAALWVRRRPALAAAYGLLAAALVLGVAGGGATWLWLRAANAERQLTQYAYADQINLAQHEWDAGDAAAAGQMLQEAGDLQEQLTPGYRPWEWEYLNRVVHPELAVLQGHTGPVTSVCFSPDGRRVATTGGNIRGADKTARLWDAESGKQIAVLEAPTDLVVSVCFSPDGRRLATADERTARLWDADSGKPLAVFQGHTGWVFSVCFSPDGGRLATASFDHTARLWDAESGKQLAVLQGHTEAVRSVCFSPDGRRIASASDDHTARLWDAESGKQLAVLQGHTAAVQCVAFSPDGRRLATAGTDNMARLWDADSGKQLAVLPGNTRWVSSMCFSPDGRRLAAASDDNTVRLWDADSGKQLTVLQGHTGDVISVAFSPDGGRLATASVDKTARLWEAASGQQLAVLEGHTGRVYCVCFSPDGGRVATASLDHTARLWDADPEKPITVLKGHIGTVNSLAFGPDGGRVATAGADKTARVWDAATGKQIAVLEGHTDAVSSVCFSPDGRRIATGSEDKTARLWDAASGKQLAVLQGGVGYTNAVDSVCFSPDGRRVAVGSDKVRLWDAESGQKIAVLEGASGPVAFSPDGRRLASASQDKAGLWDAASGQQIAVLEGHTEWVNSVCFSPDSRRVATASYDGTAPLWDAGSGKQLAVLAGASGPVAFSPDGRRLATGSADKSVRLWDAESGKPITALSGHTGWVTSVCFSPDGGRLATASSDGTARLWVARESPEYRANRLREQHRLWREQQAAEAEQASDWFAARFHLNQLLKDDPNNADLIRRRDAAAAHLSAGAAPDRPPQPAVP